MVIDFNKELIGIEAEKVRKWALKLIGDNNNNLMGWCLTCSYLIFKRLSKFGLKPQICSICRGPGSHAFIYCDGYIVDVTATQFKVKEKIIIRKNEGKHKLYFWDLRNANICSDIKKLDDHLKMWHYSCRPKEVIRDARQKQKARQKKKRNFLIDLFCA